MLRQMNVAEMKKRIEELSEFLNEDYRSLLFRIINEVQGGKTLKEALSNVKNRTAVLAFFTRRVTIEQLRKALELYIAGAKLREIVVKTGVPYWVVHRLPAMTGTTRRKDNKCKKIRKLLTQGTYPDNIPAILGISKESFKTCVYIVMKCRVRKVLGEIINSILQGRGIDTDDPCRNYVYMRYRDGVIKAAEELRRNCILKVTGNVSPKMRRLIEAVGPVEKIYLKQSGKRAVQVKRDEVGLYYILTVPECREKIGKWFAEHVVRKPLRPVDYYSLRAYLRRAHVPSDIIEAIVTTVKATSRPNITKPRPICGRRNANRIQKEVPGSEHPCPQRIR